MSFHTFYAATFYHPGSYKWWVGLLCIDGSSTFGFFALVSWPHPFLGTSNPSNLTDSKWKFREDLQEDAGVPYVCQDETSIHIICGRMSHPDIRPNVFLSHDTFPVWKSHYFAISMCVRWCITVNESWRCGKKQEPFLASLGIFSKWQNYFTVLCHAKKMRNAFLFSDAFFFF